MWSAIATLDSDATIRVITYPVDYTHRNKLLSVVDSTLDQTRLNREDEVDLSVVTYTNVRNVSDLRVMEFMDYSTTASLVDTISGGAELS